ncbi:MAG TPA: hypothetical protein VEI02_16545 [Planctomycetota bacterium]|nr:hypothetical protein [Planctomycetota bacterium]
MKLRELVTEENIRNHLQGREHLPIWDVELSADDETKLRDDAYLEKLYEEHREMQAYVLARYGNAKYEPAALAKRIKVPESHVWALWALRGSRGTGLYS